MRRFEKLGEFCSYATALALFALYVYLGSDDVVSLLLVAIFLSYFAPFISGLFERPYLFRSFTEEDFKRIYESALVRADLLSANSVVIKKVIYFADARNRSIGTIGYFEEGDSYRLWIIGKEEFIDAIDSYIAKIE